MSRMTQAERITALEIKVSAMERTLDEVNDKLDSLLALRNKGAGAFFVMSFLFGTGVMGFISILVNYIKGN